MEGGCSCGQVRYRMEQAPLFTHACHCTWCQRESGTAFALNAMIETEALTVTGALEEVTLPSASGKGQVVMRCASCRAAVYSHYAGLGRAMAFVRVGTMADPGACPPDVHIYTSTKLPWLTLGTEVPVFAEFYRRSELWPAASLARREALVARG
jgi:hypothetical protein